MHVPERVVATGSTDPGGVAWLARLPDILGELQARWSLMLGAPFDSPDVSCAWVAPVVRADGTHAVLKVGLPHMEARDEAAGLRFWAGDPTIHLVAADDRCNAMLLEPCVPGTSLRDLSEPEQDPIVSALLQRLWRLPPAPHAFRPLGAMLAQWAHETLADVERWPDAGLVRHGLRLFETLARPASSDVLLATDLHAGNILRAQRAPWLVIDPKPFVGDRAYDVTQHLLNCQTRMASDPHGTIRRLADLVSIDAERIRWWTFARAAAEPRSQWDGNWLVDLACAIAP